MEAQCVLYGEGDEAKVVRLEEKKVERKRRMKRRFVIETIRKMQRKLKMVKVKQMMRGSRIEYVIYKRSKLHHIIIIENCPGKFIFLSFF